MLGLAITIIVGLAAVSIFMLANYNRWLDTQEDSEDEK
jgi:hypothetical protein